MYIRWQWILVIAICTCFSLIYLASKNANLTLKLLNLTAPDTAQRAPSGAVWTVPFGAENQLESYLQHFDSFRNFDNFDNVTGSNDFIVPNIVHYLRFNKTSFSFVDYCCIRSCFINQRPDYIFLHTNVQSFHGAYWEKMMAEPGLKKRIKIMQAELPSQVFNQTLSLGWRLYHGSDIARIRIIQKFGGIYLDNDVYVVQNLDHYRRFEAVLGWPQGQFLGNQVIMANRNARVLPLWMDTYKVYNQHSWYYNGGERPTIEVLYKMPHLVHRVPEKLGVHNVAHLLYAYMWPQWREQDAIHLLYNHRSYMDPHWNQTGELDETNIDKHPKTIREILAASLVPFATP